MFSDKFSEKELFQRKIIDYADEIVMQLGEINKKINELEKIKELLKHQNYRLDKIEEHIKN